MFLKTSNLTNYLKIGDVVLPNRYQITRKSSCVKGKRHTARRVLTPPPPGWTWPPPLAGPDPPCRLDLTPPLAGPDPPLPAGSDPPHGWTWPPPPLAGPGPPRGQTDRHVSKHNLPVVLRTRAVTGQQIVQDCPSFHLLFTKILIRYFLV